MKFEFESLEEFIHFHGINTKGYKKWDRTFVIAPYTQIVSTANKDYSSYGLVGFHKNINHYSGKVISISTSKFLLSTIKTNGVVKVLVILEEL